MRYVNIPMVDKGYPKMEQVNEFLKLVMILPPASFSCTVPAAGIALEC